MDQEWKTGKHTGAGFATASALQLTIEMFDGFLKMGFLSRRFCSEYRWSGAGYRAIFFMG